MTEPAAPTPTSENPLFAKKGCAAPSGRHGDAPHPLEGGATPHPTGPEVAGESDSGSPAPPASLLICEPSVKAAVKRGSEPPMGAPDAAASLSVVEPDPGMAAPQSPSAPGSVGATPLPARRGWIRHAAAAAVLIVGLFAAYWISLQRDVAQDTESGAASSAAVEDGLRTPDPVKQADPVGSSDLQEGEEAEAPPSAESATASPKAENGSGAASIEPTFDVVRVEPDGTAILAGRAAPNSALIVLDNGEPIGVAQADWAGEWVLIPESPLGGQDHEFSLVVKTEQGTLSLPAPRVQEAPPAQGAEDAPPQPTSEPAGGETEAPIPARKPAAQESKATPDGDTYEVQIASVGTAAEAELELSRLQRLFPELLAERKLRIDEAKLPDQRVFFRIRTGPFEDPGNARALCARFETQRQDCLVIRR